MKLHALRGGSLIIEEVQERAKDIIAKYVCPEAVLFSGGGNLLAFMPTNKGIKAKVIGEIQNEIEGLYLVFASPSLQIGSCSCALDHQNLFPNVLSQLLRL